MISDGPMTLHDLGKAICDAFLLPGEFILSRLVLHAPTLALKLGIGGEDDGVLLPVVLSLVVWLLLALLVWTFFKLLQDAARYGSAVVRSVAFRMLDGMRGVKTRLVCDLRRLIPRRRSRKAGSSAEVEFDNLDLAILRAGAAQGAAFSVSPSKLAKQFTVRPAQVRRSLKKLRKLKMLEYAISATDGFGSYRLTQSGAAYVIMWQRQGS